MEHPLSLPFSIFTFHFIRDVSPCSLLQFEWIIWESGQFLFTLTPTEVSGSTINMLKSGLAPGKEYRSKIQQK